MTDTIQDYPIVASAHLFEAPPLRPEDEGRLGFYAALWCPALLEATPPEPHAAILFRSNNGGTSWKEAAVIRGVPTWGRLIYSASLLATNYGGRDTGSKAFVDINSGGLLQSSSESEVDISRDNLALIGSEVVSFIAADPATAEYPTAPDSVYRLTGLARGRRGTDDALTHADGDRFLLVDAAVNFVEVSPADIGRTLLFRVVPNGGDVADGKDFTLTITGRSVQPAPPPRLRASRTAADDVVVKWGRRTITPVSPFGQNFAPLHHDREEFLVEYLDTGSVLLRQRLVEGLTDTFTAAEQTADGITPGDLVRVRIRQRSNMVNGRPANLAIA